MKKVFITGITGQDGVFLTKHLLQNNEKIEIIGTTRSNLAKKLFFDRLQYLNVPKESFQKIELCNLDLENKKELFQALDYFKPKYVYNLAGPSSVYESIKNPTYKKIIINIFDNLTSTLIEQKNFCNFYQASSSEMFKECSEPLAEDSKLKPSSPYAEAKSAIHKNIFELRELYSWNLYSGITFNHDSEFRQNNYLIMKIILNAIKIKNNKINEFEVGSLSYIRDWSYSDDIVKAIQLVCEEGTQPSYIIGRGEGNRIEDIINIVFNYLDLDWNSHIKVNKKLLRKNDPISIIANPEKINNEFGWKSEVTFKKLVLKILKYKLEQKSF